jgi:hypothetical protein
MTVKKKILTKNFTNFVFKNLVLDLDPDWIRIQQQAGSGFSKNVYETLNQTINKN